MLFNNMMSLMLFNNMMSFFEYFCLNIIYYEYIMNKILNTLYIVFITILIIYSITTTMSFLSIKIESYLIYLLWFLSLIIFYLFLPREKRDIFSQNSIQWRKCFFIFFIICFMFFQYFFNYFDSNLIIHFTHYFLCCRQSFSLSFE